MKEFLNQKGILIDIYIYSNQGDKYLLSKLLKDYENYLIKTMAKKEAEK